MGFNNYLACNSSSACTSVLSLIRGAAGRAEGGRADFNLPSLLLHNLN